jgi:hypothetical protein
MNQAKLLTLSLLTAAGLAVCPGPSAQADQSTGNFSIVPSMGSQSPSGLVGGGAAHPSSAGAAGGSPVAAAGIGGNSPGPSGAGAANTGGDVKRISPLVRELIGDKGIPFSHTLHGASNLYGAADSVGR